MSRIRVIALEVVVGLTLAVGLAAPAWAPAADYGCTPGFWKNHFEHWPPTGYSPSDDFDAVFGVDATGAPTLLEGLEQKGGGEKPLMRHSVAALLNATHPDVTFLYSAAEVIAVVQAGYASGDFESAKNLLELANDEGCPL